MSSLVDEPRQVVIERGSRPSWRSREVAALQLLAAGHDTPAIAVRMGVSRGAAKNYLSRVYATLDVPSGPAAVAAAYSCGLLRTDLDDATDSLAAALGDQARVLLRLTDPELADALATLLAVRDRRRTGRPR